MSASQLKKKEEAFYFFLSRLERYSRHYLKLQLHKPLEKAFGFSFTLFNDRDSIKEALKVNKNFEPDLVFTLSKGGSFRPHHALLKIPEWHSKWVAYMHDPYPMHRYPKPFPWKEPGFGKKEEFIRLVSEKAAHPVFPSLLLVEWMGQFFPLFLKKFKVIPHQLAILDKTEGKETEVPDFFNLQKFNLLHAGNLLQARKPQGLVEGFEIFLNANPDAKQFAQLTLIGPAGHHLKYLNHKSLCIAGLKVISENRSFEEVNLLQERTTVNIILEAKSKISPFLPGKFPHCVKANKPILHLGPKISETRRLLGEEYLFGAEIDDIEGIAFLIGELYRQWKVEKDLKLNRPDLEEYLSFHHLKHVMDKILSK